MEKVTKNTLIDSLLENHDLKLEKQQLQKVLDCLFEEMKNFLAQGAVIELRGFGSFEPKLKKANNNARNPKTGQKVHVEAHYSVNFREGKDLKQRLRKLNTINDEEI